MNPGDILRRFRELDLRQQLTYAAVILVPVVLTVLLLMWATRTTYTTLASGMDPADAGKVTEALDKAGIPHKLENGGSQVSVPSEELDRARVTMATSGGATGGHAGFELFDNQKLGTTDFQQKIQYQRALEGEIARTIEGIDGISAAQVQLVLPRDQLFTDEGTPASASVLLTTNGTVPDTSIQGIAKLVQSAVEGLQAKNVTITDQTGALLWPSGPGSGSTQGEVTVKQAAENTYANQLSGRLNALLAQTLGPGKAQAQVSVDLNVDKATEEELDYSGEGIALREKTKDERLRGEGGRGGAAGTDANIPTYGQAGGDGNTRYDNNEADREFGVDKKVTKREIAPGQVNRLNVAVLIDASVPPADVAAVQQSLGAAAGVDAERGDRLTVSRVRFSGPAEPQAPGTPITDYIKYGLVAFGMLIFAFLVWRGLRRREEEDLGVEPVMVRDLSETQEPPTEVMAKPAMPAAPVNRQKSVVHTQVEGLVDQDAEQVAQQVKMWLNNE